MTTRDRLVVVIVVSLALVVGGWLLVIQPKRDQAAKLGDQVRSAQSQLDSARQQVAAGQAAHRSYATDYAIVARLGEAVPADDNVPSLMYQIQSAASASHVDFRDLVLGGSGSSSSSGSAGSGAQLPPGATAGSAGATAGPAGFPTEPFSFTFRGSFFHLAGFLGRLQRFVVANNQHVWVSGRLVTLNAISFGPAPQGFPQITASISATTYLMSPSQGSGNGATPAAPGSGTTQSASTSTSPAPSAAAVTPPVR